MVRHRKAEDDEQRRVQEEAEERQDIAGMLRNGRMLHCAVVCRIWDSDLDSSYDWLADFCIPVDLVYGQGPSALLQRFDCLVKTA